MLWAGAIFVILVMVSDAIWSLAESHKFQAQIDAIHAAGEPILPEDFLVPNAESADNAVTHLTAAASMLLEDDNWKRFEKFDLALPLRPEEIQSIDTVVNRSGEALNELALAQQQKRQQWSIDATDPSNAIAVMLPGFNNMRALANLLAADALLAHQRGDDARALKRLEQILFVAQVIDRQPTLVAHLVSIGCRAMAAQRLMEISSDLHIGPQPTDASPQDIDRVIHTLLDDKPLHDGYVWAMQGERMLELTMVRGILSGSPVGGSPGPSGQPQRGWSPVTRIGARPLIYHNARIILDQMSKIIALADSPNWPAAQKRVPAEAQGPIPLTFLARILTTALGRAIETQFRVIVEQHLAATALAIRKYAVDHNGQLPTTLDELVPKYLPAIPTDVLAAGSTPMKFLPRNNDPIAYSFGENGVDDAGSEASSTARINIPRNEWEMKDRVVHLIRPPRKPPQTDE